MIINIDNADGMTVKEFLYDRLNFSTSLVKKLKYAERGILVNGEHATVRRILSSGDTLELCLDEQSDNIVPTDLPLDIIYEDEHILAVNKPAGMPTHPSHNHYTDTLANAVMHYYAKLGEPFVFRAVNRLDADTSGIVLIAKNKHSAHLLSALMQSGGFRKRYTALLHGILEGDGEIDLPIKRADGSSMLRCVTLPDSKGSKRALTRYKVIAHKSDTTLVSAEPVTGRTHQLRVHFSHIGHPIVGDGLYGNAEDDDMSARLALHCTSLSFTHPFTCAPIDLVSPPPDEFSL